MAPSAFVLSALLMATLFCVAYSLVSVYECKEDTDCYWDHDDKNPDLSDIWSYGDCCYLCRMSKADRGQVCNRWSYDPKRHYCWLADSNKIADRKHQGKRGWWCGKMKYFPGELREEGGGAMDVDREGKDDAVR